MAFKYPKSQNWNGDLRDLVMMPEETAPEGWTFDWIESVGMNSKLEFVRNEKVKEDLIDDESENDESSVLAEQPKRRGRPKKED